MSKIHVGAFLELKAKPIIYESYKYMCLKCNEDMIRSDVNFCPECGTKIERTLVKEEVAAHLPGLLELEDKYDDLVDILYQIPKNGPDGEIYLAGNRHFPDNLDSFHNTTFAEITPETRQQQIKAFSENYRKILEYLHNLCEKGYVEFMQIKFGFIEYYR